MKILYVGHTYTIRANQAKIAALARQDGVEITLVTPQGWRGPLYDNRTDVFDSAGYPNIKHHILRCYLLGKEGAYFFGPYIFRLVAQVKPDIVHVEQGAYAVSYAQILLALKLFSRNTRSIFFTWWNLPYKPRGLKRILERFNLSNSDAAIAGNTAAKAILQSHGFQEPCIILPQIGVDLDFYRPTEQGESNRPFTIGYAGRIEDEKGVLDLVEAAAKIKDQQLVLYFVGAGAALDAVKRQAAFHGLEFQHHPPVRNEELRPHFAQMDVLVLPSRSTPKWVEQFGHILIEAMASGVPVIGSSSGEIPNVIGSAGLVFAEGSIDDLAEKLARMSDAEERKYFRNAGLARVKERYTHETIAAAQVRLYRQLLGELASQREPERMEMEANAV